MDYWLCRICLLRYCSRPAGSPALDVYKRQVAGRANLYPAAVEQIYQAFRAGEWEKARQAQESINSLQKIFAYGNPNTIMKKAAVLLGYPVGECRRPFQYLSEEGMEALRQLLQENREKGLH